MLIKILNRLGICSSLDVLQRYMHYKVSEPKNESLDKSDTIEIVSIDNIDFLHSYRCMLEYLMIIVKVVGMAQLFN